MFGLGPKSFCILEFTVDWLDGVHRQIKCVYHRATIICTAVRQQAFFCFNMGIHHLYSYNVLLISEVFEALESVLNDYLRPLYIKKYKSVHNINVQCSTNKYYQRPSFHLRMLICYSIYYVALGGEIKGTGRQFDLNDASVTIPVNICNVN